MKLKLTLLLPYATLLIMVFALFAVGILVVNHNKPPVYDIELEVLTKALSLSNEYDVSYDGYKCYSVSSGDWVDAKCYNNLEDAEDHRLRLESYHIVREFHKNKTWTKVTD